MYKINLRFVLTSYGIKYEEVLDPLGGPPTYNILNGQSPPHLLLDGLLDSNYQAVPLDTALGIQWQLRPRQPKASL